MGPEARAAKPVEQRATTTCKVCSTESRRVVQVRLLAPDTTSPITHRIEVSILRAWLAAVAFSIFLLVTVAAICVPALIVAARSGTKFSQGGNGSERKFEKCTDGDTSRHPVNQGQGSMLCPGG